ncbi:MAG TPA: bifunctional glutamate N-acetyltransferase/amino-acid acetyltransferase ArgJ [Thermodesulfovibrionales bacterium]|nr:bifunctional glutamate N-acetyltransferase/amino-acid acetyltransferase ArgJ [Thermodesulfovibrionales bacterium]
MGKENAMTPKGYLFSAAEAAIKKPGRKDLALIFSEQEAVMSGNFTTNRVKAAPVKLDMKRIRSGRGRAIVVNSGNANACRGEEGMRDALEMTELVSCALGINMKGVYVCSTGVIGTPLPMGRIRPVIPKLTKGLGKSTVDDVAAAIMTTDTFPKVVSRRLKLADRTVTITGLCKGAGMISPLMATMLCFILTDARIARSALDAALSLAVRESFNKITIDGDRSTNDTVLVMANGMARNETVEKGSADFKKFVRALSDVTSALSRMIVRDGEGATKLVEIEVRNAKNTRDAEKAAFSVANSLLVKTAIYGNDANWGRIMAALGHSGISMREEKTDISFGKVRIVLRGLATGKEGEAADVLRQREIRITINLHIGNSSARVLTCDLTEDYVRINAEYRT